MMANITISIPDTVVGRVVDALCGYYGYSTGNKNAFAKQAIITHIKQVVRSHEGRIAEDELKNQLAESVNEIDLT